MIDRDELAAWLRLVETPGVGRESARRLLREFGGPEAAIGASSQARRAVVEAAVASALAAEPPGFAALLASTVAWLDGAGGESRDVIVLGDPRYPQALLQTADPPLVLYAKGRFDRLNAPTIAIVGSRNPTAQGLENARAFAAHLSHACFTIVSGLALGIDGAAHEGALEGAGGTIAVVGTGLDRVYRPGIAASLSASSRAAPLSASSRSARRRCRPIFRSAIASSPDSPAARSSSRRPCSRARSSRRASPSRWDAMSSRSRARSIRRRHGAVTR